MDSLVFTIAVVAMASLSLELIALMSAKVSAVLSIGAGGILKWEDLACILCSVGGLAAPWTLPTRGQERQPHSPRGHTQMCLQCQKCTR